MKNLFIILALIIASSPYNFGQENNTRTEKKVIIKKIQREGDQKLSDEEIQKMIDSILIESNIKIDDDKSNIHIIKKIMDGDGKEIEIESDGEETITINNEMGDQDIEMSVERTAPNKAVMGIQLEDAPGYNGATILDIYDGSAAHKAGLNIGDIITKIESRQVNSMSDVIDALSNNKPGDKIKLQYLRNGESHKLKLTLQAPSQNSMKSCCSKNSSCCKNANASAKCNVNAPKSMSKVIIINKDDEAKGTNNKQNIEKKIIIRSNNGEDKKELEKMIQSQDKTIKMRTDSESESLIIEYKGSYPNPNQGILKVNFVGSKAPTSVQVLDMNGKEIYIERLDNFDGTYNKEINLKEAKGTLLLNIKQGDKIISEKIIVN